MTWTKFGYEKEVIGALASCSMLPGSFDKRLVRDLHNLFESDEDASLTAKQRLCVWRIAKKYRRQLGDKDRRIGVSLVSLVEVQWNALHEGIGIKGDWGRFEHQLSMEPDDWTTRSIFADFLDDQGESILADGQRWQVANNKHPVLLPSNSVSIDLYGTVRRKGSYCHRWIVIFESEATAPYELTPEAWNNNLCSYHGGRIMAEQLLAARIRELEMEVKK